ncbi:MAG: hypothetical protein M3Y91_17870 [Actinomycetota bacterium]|nr:hypothetical protein [Actinomycetota bacterium]
MRYHAAMVVGAAAMIVAAGCGGSSSKAVATGPTSTAEASTTSGPPCTLAITFDYVERTTQPGLSPSSLEIGNVDGAHCRPSIDSFAATASQAQGACTQIALASSNPGYDPNADPAPPLRKVIEQAGPGCH